ncbi:MAG TPA: YCF48-related protein [Acidimicrobiales bacterium]|nr:YCF48-related protein [Acidimicrobiales bacterium]
MTKKKDRSPRRAHKRGATPFVLVAGLVAIAALLWAVTDSEVPDRAGPAEEPGVAHVHGLGVNPGDDSLYVATHTGTFRIPEEGQAERVGTSYQDTMGFTVAGPDRFLGSGHPDVPGRQAGQPARLGLIESTDAGETWEPLSLSGDADFHGLAFAHERVYGWDATSSRFMVSDDLTTWDTRSTLQLFSFAVSPTDPDHVVGATPDGLIESVDGGRTWQPDDGPGLVALSWDTEMGLWGVEPDGTVHRRQEAGSTWEQQGRLPGEPEAMLARDGVLYAAALEDDVTGIYRSDDEGATWRLIHRDQA